MCVCPKALFLACFAPVESASIKPGVFKVCTCMLEGAMLKYQVWPWTVRTPCVLKDNLNTESAQAFGCHERPPPNLGGGQRWTEMDRVRFEFCEKLLKVLKILEDFGMANVIMRQIIANRYFLCSPCHLCITPSQRTTWSCSSSGTSTRKANHGAFFRVWVVNTVNTRLIDSDWWRCYKCWCFLS